jgi:ABC-2 type transport system ATP-binding protein
MDVIQVQQLAKTYPGGIEAVKPLDFTVAAGEVFGLLGPNGAGKSTTIGMLTTTIEPTGGSAALAGFDVATHPLAARHVSSVVFQDAVVDRMLSGRSNLETHARLWGIDRREVATRVADVTSALGVDGLLDRAVGSYSGGQRRRLEIARALLSQPRVLFLDEPTVGLDPRIRYELLDVIATLRERNDVTILLTTHYLDEAERLCNRVAIMHEGRVVASGTPASLCTALGDRVVELRVERDADSALRALRARGISATDAFCIGSTLTIPCDAAAVDAIVAMIAELGLPARALTTRDVTLDDVYLRLTGARING